MNHLHLVRLNGLNFGLLLSKESYSHAYPSTNYLVSKHKLSKPALIILIKLLIQIPIILLSVVLLVA